MQSTGRRNWKPCGGAKELENSLAEAKGELKALSGRVNDAQEGINGLEDRLMEIAH